MPGEEQKIRVFISYAQESQEFRKSVGDLAAWLREYGLEVESDHKFLNRPPRQGWRAWMQRSVENADVVLVICTPRYRSLFEGRMDNLQGGHGATWESAILTARLYQSRLQNCKIFPVLPDNGLLEDVPAVLQDFHNDFKFPSGNERILALIKEAVSAEPNEARSLEPSTPFRPEHISNTYIHAKWSARLGAIFVWWTICGFLPLASLYVDFDADGLFFAQLYPHFFLYPVLIGFFIILCLFPCVHLLRHFLGRQKFNLVTAAIALLAIYGTWADVDSGDPALWEFSRPALQLAKGNLINEARDVHKMCPFQSFQPLTSPPACVARQAALREDAKTLATSDVTRSFTHAAYVISLFTQLLTLSMAVVCVGSFVVYYKRLHGDLFSADKLMAFTFFFYFLWVPLRIFALEQKSSIYGEITLVSELPITLIIVGCYLYSIRLTWTVSRDYTIHLLQLVSAAILMYCAVAHPDLIAKIFGTSSTPFTYPLVSIVLSLLLAPWLMILESPKNGRKDGNR